MRYIYLAGPMTGAKLAEVNQWRKELTDAFALADTGVSPIWPTRGVRQTDAGVYYGMGTEPKVFTMRDMYDVRRSDLVLFNFLGAIERGSLGSAVEFGWASAMGKPILMAVDADSIHEHEMLTTLAHGIVDNVPDLIELAIHFLEDK